MNKLLNKVYCDDVMSHLNKIEGGDVFDLSIIDPPYNIGKDFGNSSDSMPLEQYLEWSDEFIKRCLELTKSGSPVYVYGFSEILCHIAVRHPMKQQRWLIWHYTNKTVPSSKFWQRSHESILCLWKGARPKININAVREKYTESFIKNAAGKPRKNTGGRFGVGKETVYKSHPNGALPRDLIKVPALAGGAGANERWFYCKDCKKLCRPSEKQACKDHNTIVHPTQKPMELTKKLILSACESPKKKVLIPFSGTGSECVVAKKLNMDFYSCDLNGDYVLLANEWLKNKF